MSSSAPTSTPAKLRSQLLNEDPDLRELVEEFVGTLSSRAAELQDAFGKQDWDLLTMLSHRLKGAGGSYGYPDLSDLGATMEKHFKEHNAAVAEVQAWLERLNQLAAAAKAGLE